MCGRYGVTATAEEIAETFEADQQDLPELRPRYNLAPTQWAPVVRREGDERRHVRLLRWGLVPFWADDATIGNRLINARAETAATKPAFRSAFRRRRCLVVADGFYEWEPRDGGKQPWFVGPAEGGPIAFAGLWEQWQSQGEAAGSASSGEGAAPLETFTILTTEANERLARLHERMPVILPPETWSAWLDPDRSRDEVRALLAPYPASATTMWPVGKRVNNPRHDDPTVLEPVEPEPDRRLL